MVRVIDDIETEILVNFRVEIYVEPERTKIIIILASIIIQTVNINLLSILVYMVFRLDQALNSVPNGTVIGTADNPLNVKGRTNFVGKVVHKVDNFIENGNNVPNINLDPMKKQGTSLRIVKINPAIKRKIKGVSS